MVPPVGCCTFLVSPSTTTVAGATTAPAILVKPSHKPPPKTNRQVTANPSARLGPRLPGGVDPLLPAERGPASNRMEDGRRPTTRGSTSRMPAHTLHGHNRGRTVRWGR